MWLRSANLVLRATLCGLALFAGGCGAGDLSGLYVAQDRTSVSALQIVEGAEQELSGTLSVVSLRSNGDMQSYAAPVRGVVNGDDLTLTARWTNLISVETGLSGVRRGDAIELTFVNDGVVTDVRFEKARAGSFERLSRELQARAATLHQERERAAEVARARRAEANHVQRIRTLIAELERATSRDTAYAERVQRAPQEFAQATADMRTWSVAYASIPEHAEGQALSRRYGLEERIRSAADRAVMLHEDLEAARQQFERDSTTYTNDASAIGCGQSNEPDCRRLNDAFGRYRQATQRLRQALFASASAYATENQRQREIVAMIN